MTQFRNEHLKVYMKIQCSMKYVLIIDFVFGLRVKNMCQEYELQVAAYRRAMCNYLGGLQAPAPPRRLARRP